MVCTFRGGFIHFGFQVFHACWWLLSGTILPEKKNKQASRITKSAWHGSLTNFLNLKAFSQNPRCGHSVLITSCYRVQKAQAARELSPLLFLQKLLWDRLIKSYYHLLLQSSIHSFMMAWYVSRSMETSFWSGSSMLHSSSRPLSSNPRLVVRLK